MRREHDQRRVGRDVAVVDRVPVGRHVRDRALARARKARADHRLRREPGDDVDRLVLQRHRPQQRQQPAVVDPDDAELVRQQAETARGQRGRERALARAWGGRKDHRAPAKLYRAGMQEQVEAEPLGDEEVHAPFEQRQVRRRRERREHRRAVGQELDLGTHEPPDAACPAQRHGDVEEAVGRADLEAGVDSVECVGQPRGVAAHATARGTEVEADPGRGELVAQQRGAGVSDPHRPAAGTRPAGAG